MRGEFHHRQRLRVGTGQPTQVAIQGVFVATSTAVAFALPVIRTAGYPDQRTGVVELMLVKTMRSGDVTESGTIGASIPRPVASPHIAAAELADTRCACPATTTTPTLAKSAKAMVEVTSERTCANAAPVKLVTYPRW